MAKLTLNEERLILLETCEKRIQSACRRGLELSLAIAKDLQQIEHDQLYLERQCESFNTYCEQWLKIDRRSANRLLEVYNTMNYLKDALGDQEVNLPHNESIALELGKLPLEHRPHAWQQIVNKNEENTVYTVREGVEEYVNELQRLAPRPQPRRGVDVDLDDEPSGNGAAEAEVVEHRAPAAAAPPERTLLTEDGEKALDRIRRICGDPVADAIENGVISMTEANLIKWSEYDNDLMRHLAYYVIEKRWTLNKALKYEEGSITNDTTVEKLELYAEARGGEVSVQHDRFKITIKQL